MTRLHLHPLLVLLFSFILIATGCRKEDHNPDPEYLIFGHSYGLCIGETCVETFKLTRDELYEDVADLYPGFGPYDFQRLSRADHRFAEELLYLIPPSLRNYPEVIGCPDCYDQGGINIEIYDGRTVRHWTIDKARSAIPPDLQGFVRLIEQKIAGLN